MAVQAPDQAREGDRGTVDGIQGGTWPQVHLLGTAALERFTGYTAQSRGRYATHTWNVTRLPEIDHGGVLADHRTPEKEVLDALRRLPETGFAIHDAPSPVEELLTEQDELRALLRQRPPDMRPRLRQAELALASAEKELDWANYRLDHAEQRLGALGPLSQLRRSGRQVKASVVDDIDRFGDDVRQAEAKIARCQQSVEVLLLQLDQRPQWDAEHDWPESRLRTVEAELAEVRKPTHDIERVSRDANISRRASGQPPMAQSGVRGRPAAPGHDLGAGLDLGL
jgi:hypothetical protein